MHIQQKHERQQGARRQIGYFKEQVCSAFRGGFLSHLLSQSQEAQNEEYYDHDADDVENVHVYSYGSASPVAAPATKVSSAAEEQKEHNDNQEQIH